MATLNQFNAIGNVSKSEIKQSKEGKNYLKFSVGVWDRQKENTTIWLNCVLFGSRATKVSLFKGDTVFVSGSISIESFIKDGGEISTSLKMVVSEIQTLKQKINTEKEDQKTKENLFEGYTESQESIFSDIFNNS